MYDDDLPHFIMLLGGQSTSARVMDSLVVPED
jgi:hypothetical protein